MIWKGEEVYPGVRQFAENMKEAIMSAHDAIITSRIQQTVQANRKRKVASFQVGDLVYLSTKNISMPKGRARKLAPKYLGPFPITKVIKEGATYQLDLSEELVKRGVNRAFHASLLRPHVPNDDRRFPGRMPIQIPGFGEKPEEWIVDRIVTHHGKGTGSDFLILWKAGDRTWATYREVAHLNALDRYCELMGVKGASELPSNYVNPEPEDEEVIIQARACVLSEVDKRESEMDQKSSTRSSLNPLYSLTTTEMVYTGDISDADYRKCSKYERRIHDWRTGKGEHPGSPPTAWIAYQSYEAAMRAVNVPQPAFPPVNDNVSMPADTLEAIIRAIGNNSQDRPIRFYREPPVHVPAPRRPANNNHHNHNNNGNGGNRGRGGFGGRGRGAGPNRRGIRSGPPAAPTKDPRRNPRDNQKPIPVPPPVNSNTPTPAASTSAPEPITLGARGDVLTQYIVSIS